MSLFLELVRWVLLAVEMLDLKPAPLYENCEENELAGPPQRQDHLRFSGVSCEISTARAF